MGRPGGNTAFQRLVDDQYATLYRFAFRLSGNADVAGDLTQDAFCKAQAQFAQLRDAERARPWLYSIVRNAYLHRLRTERNHREVPLEWADGVGREDVRPQVDIDPARLQEVLDEMPESFRTPLILFYFEEFSYRDIAEQMEVPMGTVMSRLARAKAYLRERLAPSSNGE